MKFIFLNTLLTLILAGSTCLVSSAYAQLLKEELPPMAQSIDVEDRVGEFIPLDLIFKDERGNASWPWESTSSRASRW
jgi:hypothetical protein